MKKEKRLWALQNGLIYFFLCSYIGWILEVIYAFIVLGKFVNRGFLYGPICPIYGYGALLMIVIAEAIRKKDFKSILLKFILVTLMFTALEYLTSFFIEWFFNIRCWDYTEEFMNLHGRICLLFSLTFGIMGLFFIQCVYEPTKNIIRKIRRKVPDIIIWLTSGLFVILWIIDTAVSMARYI